MIPIPRRIKTLVSAKEITQVQGWWEKLNEDNQKELQSLYDSEEQKDEKTVAIYLSGKYVEQERPDDRDIFWINHLYNYIVNHELQFEIPIQRVSYICSANKIAANAIKSGIIPIDFQCPEKKKDCLMLSILKEGKGKSVLLKVNFKIE